MDKMMKNLPIIGGDLLTVGVIALLAAADARMFEDAEFSPLYDATLKEAFNRFKQSDRKVPARGGASPAYDPGAAARGLGVQGQVAQGSNAAMIQRRQMQQRNSAMQRSMLNQSQANRQQMGPPAPGMGAPRAQVPAIGDGGVHTRNGNQFLANKQYDKAIAEFRLALQENPNRPLAQHHIGDALRYKGQHREAIAAYEEVLKISPSYYCCFTHIGDIQSTHLKDAAAAEAAFAQGVRGYRQQIQAGGPQGTLSKYHLGKFFADHKRNLPEAQQLAEQAIAETPDQPVYLLLLAQIYENTGRKQDAIALMDKALQSNPTSPEVYKHYKEHLLKQGAPAAITPKPPAG